MTALDNLKQQVSLLPTEDKQTLRFYINQTLREQNKVAFRRSEAMRQIELAFRGGFQF